MTKSEIIRELSKINPCFIRRLDIIYHNRCANVKYVFSYKYAAFGSDESLRELARVILSLWKLRRFIVSLGVEYFPFDDYGKDYGECIVRTFQSSQYVHSVVDFIKTIKK